MKIALFDWTAGGHHPLYARRFAEALLPATNVAVAAPDEVLAQLADLDVELLPLGDPRPLLDRGRPHGPQHRELAERELDLFVDTAARSDPDHLVHLYADPVLRRLVRRPPLPVPTTLCVFFPRAHYPKSYASPLAPRERLRAWFLEYLIARWRARADAHALFTLDEIAATRWSRRGGPRTVWLPEPPIRSALPEPAHEREGCVLYGTLAARKGIGLVTDALSLAPTTVRIVLGGEVEPDFRHTLERHTAAMEQAGASVELRLGRHSEAEGLRLLAAARCVLLPYVNHYTGSRVLLEAASVGTPVVAHEQGLLGHLVRRHGLGVTVDCRDAPALRAALLRLAQGPDVSAEYSPALERFAALHTSERFQRVVLSPFSPVVAARAPTMELRRSPCDI